MRNMTITETVTLVTENCCTCGVLFAFTEEYKREARRDHRWWYCPNGHTQQYVDKSDAEKLREANRQIASLEEDVRVANAATRSAQQQHSSLLKRVEKGICPHCRRHFANVERHCERQHPGKPKPARTLP